MKKSGDVDFVSFDLKSGATVDFETDRLPASDGHYDTVLFLNVMEHIYNHQHIANEVVRIVKPGGQLIGFVPFLMWYHADHRDFFRYTHEALHNIFTQAGASTITIEVIGKGPFLAAAHMVLQSFPRFMRPAIFGLFLLLDIGYGALKKKGARPYALGYYFKIIKPHA
jgi:SAM-dependent methyltransferase